MRRSRFLLLLVALSLGLVFGAYGQDDESPSLGDIARQSRQAKQQPHGVGNTSATQAQNNGNTATVSNGASSQSSVVTAPKNAPGDAQKKPVSPAMAAVKNNQPGKSAKRVITNEDMGAVSVDDDVSSASKANAAAEPAGSEPTDGKNPPEVWSSQILTQQNAIVSLQSNIDQLSASIEYAPSNCVEGCAAWNQHQQEKQQQVDTMKSQLEEMQKHLEEMQDAARKQGYGSSVYDP